MQHKVVMYVMGTFEERLRLDELADALPVSHSSAWCAYEWLFDAIESQRETREIRIWVDVNGDWMETEIVEAQSPDLPDRFDASELLERLKEVGERASPDCASETVATTALSASLPSLGKPDFWIKIGAAPHNQAWEAVAWRLCLLTDEDIQAIINSHRAVAATGDANDVVRFSLHGYHDRPGQRISDIEMTSPPRNPTPAIKVLGLLREVQRRRQAGSELGSTVASTMSSTAPSS